MDVGDLYLQAERMHDERRTWHVESMAVFNDAAAQAKTRNWVFLATMGIRPVIETAILVVLILIWRAQ